MPLSLDSGHLRYLRFSSLPLILLQLSVANGYGRRNPDSVSSSLSGFIGQMAPAFMVPKGEGNPVSVAGHVRNRGSLSRGDGNSLHHKEEERLFLLHIRILTRIPHSPLSNWGREEDSSLSQQVIASLPLGPTGGGGGKRAYDSLLRDNILYTAERCIRRDKPAESEDVRTTTRARNARNSIILSIGQRGAFDFRPEGGIWRCCREREREVEAVVKSVSSFSPSIVVDVLSLWKL